jgi:hypothetical protein
MFGNTGLKFNANLFLNLKILKLSCLEIVFCRRPPSSKGWNSLGGPKAIASLKVREDFKARSGYDVQLCHCRSLAAQRAIAKQEVGSENHFEHL